MWLGGLKSGWEKKALGGYWKEREEVAWRIVLVLVAGKGFGGTVGFNG